MFPLLSSSPPTHGNGPLIWPLKTVYSAFHLSRRFIWEFYYTLSRESAVTAAELGWRVSLFLAVLTVRERCVAGSHGSTLYLSWPAHNQQGRFLFRRTTYSQPDSFCAPRRRVCHVGCQCLGGGPVTRHWGQAVIMAARH